VELVSYVYNENVALDYGLLSLLYVGGFLVIICYCMLYLKFIKLMRIFPELSRQVHPFFVFMIAILSIKFILLGFWEFDSKLNQEDQRQVDGAVYFTNIGIEILFNILLIYYQVTCNKRQTLIDGKINTSDRSSKTVAYDNS